jgi:sodium/bile acid cotransporter 7
VKQFVIHRWFLIALALVLGLGIGLSDWLSPLTQVSGLRQTIVVVVMFLMALPLEAGAVWETLRRPWASLLATALNYGLLPLSAWATSLALWHSGTLGDDMVRGILVASAVPCTLASAAVWTRRAGGNDAVAMMVTVITNLLCFIVTPAWLWLTIGDTPRFSPLAMLTKLGLLVVLPMVLAQLLRPLASIGPWATRHKTPLSVASQCGILFTVFLGAIGTGTKLAGGSLSSIWFELSVMIAVVLCIHVATLSVGIRLARWMRLSRGDSIAVGIAGSQKTVMVGLEVSAQLGVTFLPMVAFHVGQLLADTAIADRLQQRRKPAP